MNSQKNIDNLCQNTYTNSRMCSYCELSGVDHGSRVTNLNTNRRK
jgi:hypothetical protein